MAEQHLQAKIKGIKNTRKPLVVLLKGPGKDSSMMEVILRTSGLATLRDQATLFVLMAPDEVSELPAVALAFEKAALPRLQSADLPVVLVLDADGKALSVTKGLVTAGELQQSLTRAVASFSTQAGQSKTAEQPGPATDNTTTGKEATTTPVVSTPVEPTQSSAEAAPQPSASPSVAVQQPATPVMTHQPASGLAKRPATTAAADSIDPNQNIQLQINLPDGENIRASFKAATLLQDVRSHIQQTRPELNNQDYSIVSLHLGREFSADDLTSSLADLGVQSQTSLRLRSQQPHIGRQGNLLEKLTQLLSLFNPMGIMSWILSKVSGSGAQSSQRGHEQPGPQQSEEQASGSSTARQNAYSQAMKRKNAEARKVHTLHDDADQEGQGDNPDGNSYWNGNSTKFDADDQ